MWRRGPTLLFSYNSLDLHTALNTLALGKSCQSSRRFRARVKLEKEKNTSRRVESRKKIQKQLLCNKNFMNYSAVERYLFFFVMEKGESESFVHLARSERTLSLRSSSEDEWSQSEEFSSFSSMMMAMWFRRTSIHRDRYVEIHLSFFIAARYWWWWWWCDNVVLIFPRIHLRK